MNKINSRIFFDESGSIPKTRMDKIFMVACTIPINPNKKVQNRFKSWKKKYCHRNNLNIKEEVKGSQISNNDILFFALFMKDFVKVVYSWFNADKIRNENWLNNSKLTHNYLIWLTTERQWN